MRSTKLISISLPPELLTQVIRQAKAEDRSTSGLCREALRFYMAEKERQKQREADNAAPIPGQSRVV